MTRIHTNDLIDRTAVVAGAGSGIGRLIAQLLAERGALVHVVDIDLADRRARTVDLYRTKGTSPDVVARQAGRRRAWPTRHSVTSVPDRAALVAQAPFPARWASGVHCDIPVPQ